MPKALIPCFSTHLETHRVFDPSQSSTYKSTELSLSIHYGTGEMEGIVGSDTVTVSVPTALLGQWRTSHPQKLICCLLTR